MLEQLEFAWRLLGEFARFVSPYWPALALLILVYLAAFLLRRRPAPLPEDNSAALDYFFRRGYQLEEILFQGRRGGEYILSRLGARVCLHLKWWKKALGEKPVLALAGAKNRNTCEFAILVAGEGFSRRARRLAQELGVWLIPYHRLENELEHGDGSPASFKPPA
jgi:hypothetical protein